MQLGKVTGTVVASHKDEGLDGLRLMIVETCAPAAGMKPLAYHVAVDAVGAGIGEYVLVVTGSSARMATQVLNKPVDASIIAVVDSVEAGGKTLYTKADAKAAAGRK